MARRGLVHYSDPLRAMRCIALCVVDWSLGASLVRLLASLPCLGMVHLPVLRLYALDSVETYT